MLAEGDKPYLFAGGFDATYPWEMFHMMEKIKDLPYPGYPNLTSVLPRIGVESFHANVMQSIFGNGFRELVAPRFISPQYIAKAKKAAPDPR